MKKEKGMEKKIMGLKVEPSKNNVIFKNEYDAVVFDMDGVIFDSERATMYCWLEIAEKYGIENI